MQDIARIVTGNSVLDTILGGGLLPGKLLLIEGQGGAGSTEFVLTILRGVARTNMGRSCRFASALRSPERVRREMTELFSEKDAALLEVVPLDAQDAWRGFKAVLAGLEAGDIVALESTAALHRAVPGGNLASPLQVLADAANETGVTVLVLHTHGSLPREEENCVTELADGTFTFVWRDGGTTRRRLMFLSHLRGLAPILDGEEIPVFEVALHQGAGFTLSRVKNVV